MLTRNQGAVPAIGGLVAQRTEGSMTSKADEYRAKSLQCEMQASKVTDADARSKYEALARSWASLADNVDLRHSPGQGQDQGQGATPDEA
jgi:hypothetical protein